VDVNIRVGWPHFALTKFRLGRTVVHCRRQLDCVFSDPAVSRNQDKIDYTTLPHRVFHPRESPLIHKVEHIGYFGGHGFFLPGTNPGIGFSCLKGTTETVDAFPLLTFWFDWGLFSGSSLGLHLLRLGMSEGK
jgi:hypothetical protein